MNTLSGIRTFVCLIASAVLTAALYAPSQASALASGDATFLRSALQLNTTAIREAFVYVDAVDSRVSTYAHKMSTDYSEANTQLLTLAKARRISVARGQLPEVPARYTSGPYSDSPNGKEKQMAGVTAQRYFMHQINVHERAETLYEAELRSGTDPQLLAFAKQQLAVIKAHLALAKLDLAAERKI